MRMDSQGVQRLKVAEKAAADMISNARKRKAARLKQAKEEAQAEVQKFRKGKEQSFKEFETQILGSREDSAAKIEKDTITKLDAMGNSVAQNKSDVIKYLLSEGTVTLAPTPARKTAILELRSVIDNMKNNDLKTN